MLRDDSFHLRQMLEAAHVSRSFTQDRVRSDLDSNLMQFFALVKAVEIIGEAAAHVSQGFKSSHPDTDWDDINGMRNWLVHAYYNINRDVIGETVRDDVPLLITHLEDLLAEGFG